MKRGFVHKGMCLLLSAMLCLSGCERAGENTEGVATIETGVSKIEQLEKQELEARTSKIHVMIDLNGYDVEEDKNVFFSGVKEQTNFRLVDTKSRRTVFSAEIEPEDVISYGDFTQWNTPGEYYIEIDRLGRSCNFLIEDGVQRQNLTDAIENMTIELKYIIAGVLFVIASLTDFIDGKVARKYNMVTDFGKMIDAISDKILTNTLIVVLACDNMIHPVIAVIIIARDIIVDSIKMLIGNKGKAVAAIKVAKFKTASLMIGLTLKLFYDLPFSLIPIRVSDFLLILAAVLAIISGAKYYIMAKEYITDK